MKMGAGIPRTGCSCGSTLERFDQDVSKKRDYIPNAAVFIF